MIQGELELRRNNSFEKYQHLKEYYWNIKQIFISINVELRRRKNKIKLDEHNGNVIGYLRIIIHDMKEGRT